MLHPPPRIPSCIPMIDDRATPDFTASPPTQQPPLFSSSLAPKFLSCLPYLPSPPRSHHRGGGDPASPARSLTRSHAYPYTPLVIHRTTLLQTVSTPASLTLHYCTYMCAALPVVRVRPPPLHRPHITHHILSLRLTPHRALFPAHCHLRSPPPPRPPRHVPTAPCRPVIPPLSLFRFPSSMYSRDVQSLITNLPYSTSCHLSVIRVSAHVQRRRPIPHPVLCHTHTHTHTVTPPFFI